MIIGITGGTGCGKTTLLKMIEGRGGLVLDCDTIYHRLLITDTSLLRAIEARFPGTIENGALQRKKLGTIVFSDPSALSDLNHITHSAVRRAVTDALQSAPPLAAIDAIALFEGELAPLCDVTVAVTAPVEDRITRLMQRDQISREYATSRIAAQHDAAWYRSRCDYVLENDGTIDAFATKCIAFLSNLGIM